MKPKEKAEQLVKKYSCLYHGIEEDLLEKVVISDYAIESALITVDEILEAIPNEYLDYWQGESQMILNEDVDYWNEVKQEIEKL